MLHRAGGDGEGNDRGRRFSGYRQHCSCNSLKCIQKQNLSQYSQNLRVAELVDDYVIDIPQNTWIEQPWDLGLTFVPPLARK